LFYIAKHNFKIVGQAYVIIPEIKTCNLRIKSKIFRTPPLGAFILVVQTAKPAAKA